MKVLIVDDDEKVRKLVAAAMEMQGYRVWTASSGEEALALAVEREFDLVFCDVMMPPGITGFEVMQRLREELRSQADVVLMTGLGSVEAAIDAVHRGANDYVCKPFSVSQLHTIAAASRERRHPHDLVQAAAAAAAPADAILGNSRIMIEVVKTATRVAATELPVLICGESGTGKELIARLIHRSSARADGPFVPVNCGAMPDTLLESELFGHTRGAFTGADAARRGLFEEANGGTLLLDEVTETTPAFQVKLLRTLQEGEVRSLGSNVRRRVDVRVVSATNRHPQALIEAGLFREDLLYRLQGVSITVPPLRERREDISTMALSLLSSYSPNGRNLSITRSAMTALEHYDWPGNVRELKHLMQRLAALSRGVISVEDLPSELLCEPTVASVMDQCLPDGELPTMAQLEAAYVLHVLSAVKGNKSKAAHVLAVDRKTLYRMIEKAVSSRKPDRVEE